MTRIYRTRELNSFRTKHELHRSEKFVDSRTFHAFAFAIDPATNLPVDIAQFTIANSFNDFTMSSRNMKVTKDFTYDTDSGPTTVEIIAHALEVEISRSKFAQALTMCMFATNWVLTIASAHIVFSAVTKGRVDFMAVILHSSVALAILGIRRLYVSPPPFGAFLGILCHNRPFHSLMIYP
jgi:hypothetical protein